ncbi:MAG: RNA polymerase sigma factor [Spirochaetaceae bacterium]|nr:MAG: RNA polymerase sigma factor [Spirochaetaceae bacterium]
MNQENILQSEDSKERLARAYQTEKHKLTKRARAAGRSWEEAEDLIHDVYVETWGSLGKIAEIANLPAWLNSLVTRRLIDAWRHDKVKKQAGEIDTAEETLREVIAGAGLDPRDSYIRHSMAGALNEAIKLLPREQREVVESQVFGGKTFAELAERTGESIDTLKARKRYALQKLSHAMRHWIEK